MTESADERVRYTAKESLSSKYSAYCLRYFADPLVSYMQMRINRGNPPTKRAPMINRGYYSRVVSVERALSRFLKVFKDQQRQLLFLGCGYDTLGLKTLSEYSKVSCFEVDFSDVIGQKSHAISSERRLLHCVSKDTVVSSTAEFLIAEGLYKIGELTLLASDLRDVDSVTNMLIANGFDPTLPTFILTECVLVYLSKDAATSLCNKLGSILTQAVWITYDMVTPEDAFGKTMVKNLKSASFDVPGIIDYPTLVSQEQRFLQCGWNDARSITMLNYYNSYIDEADKKRLSKLEILDEFEEWNLLMSHYSLTIATKALSIIHFEG